MLSWAEVASAGSAILTAAAAMMCVFFILDDPVLGGLAVTLISGVLVSTVLTLVVIHCCTLCILIIDYI